MYSPTEKILPYPISKGTLSNNSSGFGTGTIFDTAFRMVVIFSSLKGTVPVFTSSIVSDKYSKMAEHFFAVQKTDISM